MNTVDFQKRLALKAASSCGLVLVSGGIVKPANAIEPLTASALIAALVTLFTHFDNKPVAQLQASAEMPRTKEYTDFNMINSDPNILVRIYGSNGGILLSYQAPLATNAILTVQDGVPYLHYSGLGNIAESNMNRWEAKTFGQEAEASGEMPVPSSVRFDARDRATASNARYLLNKRGVNSEEWAPQYVRSTAINGKKDKQMVVAQNVNSRDKKAFWI